MIFFKSAISVSILIALVLAIFSPNFMIANKAYAAGKFSIEAKINLKSLDNPNKLKVVASANGDNDTKYLSGSDLKSNTATVSFEFNQKMTLLPPAAGMNILSVHTP